MKKRRWFSMPLAIIGILLITSSVFAYTYRAAFVITDDSGPGYAMLPVMQDNKTTFQVDYGFITATARDTRVATLGGSEKPHMIATDKILTAVPVATDSQTNLYYTTGNTLADFDMIAGYDGFALIPDEADLEFGNNFEMEFTDLYIDTSAGNIGANLIFKPGAYRAYVQAASKLRFTILGSATTSPTGFVASAWVTENQAYDANVGTNAKFNTAGTSWTDDLELTVGATDEDTAGYYISGELNDFTLVDLDVYYDGGWVDVYQGAFASSVWEDYSLGGTRSVTKYRIKMYNASANVRDAFVWETRFGHFTEDLTVDITPVATGERDVILSGTGGGTNLLGIDVDGTPSTVALAGNSIPDTDDDHVFLDGCPYMTSLELTNSGASTTLYEPEAIIVNYDDRAGTETAGGSDVLITDAGIVEAVDHWQYALVTITETTDNLAPEGEQRQCSTSAVGSITVGTAFSANIDIGDDYLVEIGEFEDLDATGGDEDARIMWGINPSTVATSLGGMVSSSQTYPGGPTVEAARDILPDTDTTDWYVEPAVAGSLLTNPMRPFVTMVSDNTSLNETQVWQFYGLIAVVMATVMVAVSLRGHLLFAGLAAGATIGGLVALSIWPFWTIIFIAIVIFGGIVAEKNISL